MLLATLKNDLEQLFDKSIRHLSMEEMYNLAPFSKVNYHPICPLCLGIGNYHVMFDDSNRRENNMLCHYRDQYVKQFKHELFFHANLNQIIRAIDHFNGFDHMNPSQKTSLDLNSTSTPCSDINVIDIERGSKGACTEGACGTPLSYTLAIDKICKFHVSEIESFIETGMLKDNGATWFNYLIPAGAIRDYLIAHIDKASDGCFEMVSLDENKCRVSIKKVKGPTWPL